MSQPPVNVSPLIKLARYSMLTMGIFYGLSNHKRLSIKESAYREKQAKLNEIRDKKLAIEKEHRADMERRALALLSGQEK